MGHWGVKSYEHDDAADALDAGFDRVHGERYEDLMDDRNPLTFEQAQHKLADPQTLDASIAALRDSLRLTSATETWDEQARLALVGIVVRYAELGVPIPEFWRALAIEWLEKEDIDWHEATARRLRRRRETELLNRISKLRPSGEANPRA
jgi:hypothetical protein